MVNEKIIIRTAKIEDFAIIQKLFVETIENVCQFDYTSEQIKVWQSSVENKKKWSDKLMNQYFLVAEIENVIVGFASLENNDYLDFMYVHYGYLRQGIAEKLFMAIQDKAYILGSNVLNSDVSKTAIPFFKKMGFEILKEQKNLIQGVDLINFKMSKNLFR